VIRRTTRDAPASVGELWPPPAQTSLRRVTRSGQVGYLVVPSLRRPRVLVPLALPEAGLMLTRHGGTTAERAARTLWRGLHHVGIPGRLPVTRLCVTTEPDGIESYLSAALSRPVRIGVLLGPPRANAKPVLQIFDEAGATIAFAKLGSSTLTAALVDNEAMALALLGRSSPQAFTAPRLLHHGQWRHTPVVVQQALALSQSNRAPDEAPIAVMAEIAAVAGIHDRWLGDSDFLTRTAPGPQSHWHDVDLQPFGRLHAALTAAGSVPFGASHGDFGPWNMGTDGDRFEVWDWERFDPDVPLGFDAAHYRTQKALDEDLTPDMAWPAVTVEVSRLLDATDRDPDRAAVAAGCYLVAICSRYRRDAGDDPTPNLLRRMRWLSAAAAVAARSLDEAYA
jgi:hypothetical protein